MKTILAAAVVLMSAHTVRADESFESRAQGAQRIGRLDDLVWALTATCDQGDDVQQRQCRHVRDARQKQLAGATLLVDAQPTAFEVGKWSAAKKSVPFTLIACIHCGGVAVDGKTYYVTGLNASPTMEGGKLRATRILDSARSFPDEGAAATWITAVATARIQLLVKVPEPAAKLRWQAGGKDGLAFEILAYRVYTPCDGAVVVASPAAGALPADKKACGKSRDPNEFQMDDDGELTTTAVRTAMRPVIDAARACFDKYKLAGTGKLDLTIAADGTVAKVTQTGDFTGTPTGKCIDNAMPRVAFPKTSKRTKIVFPIVLK